ncbi:MAG: hypothetical protein DHS20C07_08790 [Methyloligella sp.]|nr:MAG: hypothetical protein DHS20C07_08790 [Methyloligella sp.]
MQYTRRNFVKQSLCATAFASSQSFTANSFAAITVKNQDNEDTIIEAVKNLKAGKNIQLKLLYPQGSIGNIKPVATLFTKLTGVKISFIKTTVDDINTKIFIDTAGQKSSFDIALPATFGIPDLAEAGALADQSSYAEKYEKHIDYKPSLYSLGDRYKRAFYGYQTDGDAYLTFFHKDCMENPDEQKRFADKHGHELTLPQTWKELDQLMEFFHRPDEEKFGGCLFRTPGYMVWEWWIRFHAKNYFPVQDDMTPNINNQAGVEALEDLLRATQFQHPSALTNGIFENWREYAKGHCAVNIGWGGTQKYLNSKTSKMKGRMLFAPTPQISYFNWGWNYVTSKLSVHKEIAYLFSLYATIAMPSKIAVQNQTGFFDPFREGHYTDPKIEQSYSKEFLVAHKQAMKTAIPDFYLKGQGKYIQTLRENITSAAEKEISPQEALSFTAKQWEMITEEEGREGQIEQWLFLKKQYPKHLNLK